MQITTDFTYLFLNGILLLTFIISGQLVSRKANYWSCAIWCIVAFTLIQGLRYDRGNDYKHYTEIFMGLGQQSYALFIWLNSVLAQIGFDKHTCFIFYAFIFSTCSMIFLQNFKKCAKWTFPLFIIGYLFFNEYQIRQAFSYSFFFLYMHFLFKIPLSIKEITHFNTKSIVLALIAAVLCIELHHANGIILTLFTLLYVFVRRPLTYWISIPVYLAFVYIVPNVFDLKFLELFFVVFSDSDTLSNYIEHADQFFSETAMDDIYDRNPIIQVFEAFGVSSLLYIGYNHIKDKSKPHYPGETAYFYCFLIGTCILSAFRKLELMNRMGYDLSLLLYFLIGIILSNTKHEIKGEILLDNEILEVEDEEDEESEENVEYIQVSTSSNLITLAIRGLAYLLLIWFIYDYLKYLLLPGKKTLFLWDIPFIHSF